MIKLILKSIIRLQNLTITSGAKMPNWTLLIFLIRHFECVKFKLGFDISVRYPIQLN